MAWKNPLDNIVKKPEHSQDVSLLVLWAKNVAFIQIRFWNSWSSGAQKLLGKYHRPPFRSTGRLHFFSMVVRLEIHRSFDLLVKTLRWLRRQVCSMLYFVLAESKTN